MMVRSKARCPRKSWVASRIIDTTPTIRPPANNGTPNRIHSAIAPPITSARSVAATTISAWAQNASRAGRGSRSPINAGRLRPATRPSLADRYCTSTAIRLASTRTQTSR